MVSGAGYSSHLSVGDWSGGEWGGGTVLTCLWGIGRVVSEAGVQFSPVCGGLVGW